MMNVFKNLPARFLFCAATSVAAFGCSDNESEQATCTTVSVQSQEYCVYRGQNILVGDRLRLPLRHDAAPRDRPDHDRLLELADAAHPGCDQ